MTVIKTLPKQLWIFFFTYRLLTTMNQFKHKDATQI